ncbi:MAG: signal peptidase I [Clostridia bacterium]|nr:signal peptidase I [Clostridia bacterium]
MANLFSKKIKGEEHRSQLQPVVFADQDKPIAALKKSQIDNYDELESYKKLRKKRITKAFARMAVWVLVLILVPIFVFFSLIIINPREGHNFFGYIVYMVASHSMKQDFDKGDCIIIKKVTSRDEVYIGRDITFIRQSDGETVTHRIVDTIINDKGEIEYITKGTNVLTCDPGSVAFENIIGVRVKTAFVLGGIISFFRTPYGIVTFVGLFVLMISAFYFSFKISNDIRAVGKINV